jgi:hypothetical protein
MRDTYHSPELKPKALHCALRIALQLSMTYVMHIRDVYIRHRQTQAGATTFHFHLPPRRRSSLVAGAVYMSA